MDEGDETLNHYVTSHTRRKKLMVRRNQQPQQQENVGILPRNAAVRGMEHIFFGKGSQVEVGLGNVEEGFYGSWFQATIVESCRDTSPSPTPSSPSSTKKKRKMEPERYLVEYATLVEESEDDNGEKKAKKPLREYVDVGSMRQPPPPTESQHAYELKDVVDAFYRDGWWTGVVTEVLDEGSRFAVFFENPPEKEVFPRSALRVHHDWVDNKWVRAEKKAHILLDDCTPKKAAKSAKGFEGHSIKGSGTKTSPRRHGKSSENNMESKKKLVTDRCSPNVKKETIEPNSGVSSQYRRRRGRPRKLTTGNPLGLVNDEKNGAESTAYEMVVKENPLGFVNGEEKNGADSTSYAIVVKDCASKDGEELTLGGICPQEAPIVKHGYPSQLPERQFNVIDDLLDFRLVKVDNQASETNVGKSRRKPRSCTSKRRMQGSRTNKSPTQDSQGPGREKPSELFEDRPRLVWYDSSTEKACTEKACKESTDRPQSMLLEGMNSRYGVHDSKTSFDLNVVQSADASDGQDESSMRSPTNATCDSNVPEKDKKFPFQKRSPIWATLERMEIFQKMPQNPHFSPLFKSKEDSREGLAIGQMVIFSSVVEKTSKLQISDPRSIIDSCLETLSDLETHGFDVKPVRLRLKELLSKKENQGHLLEESKEVEMKIAEQNIEKVKLGEEICEINKMMEELHEKLTSSIAMEKRTAGGIDTLKSKMGVIDQAVQNAQRDFEKLAAAPW